MLLKKAREMNSAKTVMGGGGLPGNYLIQADACKCRSISCRGDSAGGTTKTVVTEAFLIYRYVVRFVISKKRIISV
jgi:hypothetical protein